jgi:cell division protein FtsN
MGSEARNWAFAAAAAAFVAAAGAGSAFAYVQAGDAAAGVRQGIDAWRAGDYAGAIAAWRPLAEAGNADAQFNLGQAYRLGRGVPSDMAQAQIWFERAARQGHAQAETNLGLTMFQSGQRQQAVPWLERAAERGDPRAQYYLGTAHFNGDLVALDWPRAYALMRRAADQGLPQARQSLTQMEPHLSAQDRQRGTALAQEMAARAPATSSGAPIDAPLRTAEAPRPPLAGRPAPPPARTPRARETSRRSSAHCRRPSSFGTIRRRPREAPKRPPRVRLLPPVPLRRLGPLLPLPRSRPHARRGGGRWRVQLGAFSNQANAERQWGAVRRVGALSGLQRHVVRAGPVYRLQAGPFPDRASAQRACSAARASGHDCLVVAP